MPVICWFFGTYGSLSAMAIGANSIVSPKNTGSGGAGIAVRGPIFGFVESGAGPCVVLWNNGTRVENIAVAALDEILEAADATELKVGARVQVTGQSNWGQGICVAAYKRSGTDYVLIVNDVGAYREVVASSVTVV